eukprot:NODE_6672_length_495_cov_60.896861_g5886_i0.p1 GENE.NODE_6672_length_495_cov_60.896861_g5886_i0~~NODE_6672_length_495_cov_60.896861_g5886_i0.p1  ORF type:complete len:99 (-),score=31.30 NODE_6672_length_495_cov_60.896861_g5886_i0:198-452(-)
MPQMEYTNGEKYEFPPGSLTAELGEVCAGMKPGRQNDYERIIDWNCGMAIQDMLLADAIVKRAKTMKLGRILKLADPFCPLPEI